MNRIRMRATPRLTRPLLALLALAAGPALAVNGPNQININLTYTMVPPTCTVTNLNGNAASTTPSFSTGLPVGNFTATTPLSPVSLTSCSNATNATVTFGTNTQAVAGDNTLFKPSSTINATTAGFKLELQNPGNGQWATVQPGNTSTFSPGNTYNFRYSLKHLTGMLAAGATTANIVVNVTIN